MTDFSTLKDDAETLRWRADNCQPHDCEAIRDNLSDTLALVERLIKFLEKMSVKPPEREAEK